jgi:hypothetical protein
MQPHPWAHGHILDCRDDWTVRDERIQARIGLAMGLGAQRRTVANQHIMKPKANARGHVQEHAPHIAERASGQSAAAVRGGDEDDLSDECSESSFRRK